MASICFSGIGLVDDLLGKVCDSSDVTWPIRCQKQSTSFWVEKTTYLSRPKWLSARKSRQICLQQHFWFALISTSLLDGGFFHSKNSPDINSEASGCQKIWKEINPHRVSLFLFPFKKKSICFQSGFQFQINFLMTSWFIPSYTNSNEFYFFKYYLVNIHQVFLG